MQALAGFAGAAAIYFAARKGAGSFDLWLEQRKAERAMEAGEKILTVVYAMKDAFASIRSPGHFAYELEAAETKLRESMKDFSVQPSGKQARLKTAQVILTRANSHSELWKELSDSLPLARAYFGKDLDENLRNIFKARADVIVAAQMYPDVDSESSAELVERFEAAIWDGWAEARKKPDPIRQRVDEAIALTEKAILPILSNPSRRDEHPVPAKS